MTDKQPMQASGQDSPGTRPDGIEDAPAKGAGGESGGGAYPNPQTGKKEKNEGFLKHGGQTEMDYSGPGGENDDKTGNPNAVTGG
ncbi:hypothetical protein [Sphingomonas mollis]|uniref:Uncharacterized protein n=1 Tax=Sphingomonas mollis TaxID=2795726 RepID=A0ABS0XQ73_9SPHN|nr:hypothetical protein [Sphingomonas sp. BT553]MBJ6122182.1 hypothetical protein [Sphingomonas sp. BT553]